MLVGRALGAVEQARALVADARQAVADFRAAHPKLAGKRYSYGYLPPDGSMQIYTADGPTTQFVTGSADQIAGLRRGRQAAAGGGHY